MLGPRWVRAVGTVGFGSTHPVGTRAQSPPGSRACRRDVAVSEGRAMELSEAYEQTPAQTASQAWRYVVAQATGILMARFRISSEQPSRDSPPRQRTNAVPSSLWRARSSRRSTGRRQRGPGLRGDHRIFDEAPADARAAGSGGRLARFSDFRRTVPLTLEPGHVLTRCSRCFHDDGRHLTHTQLCTFRSFAEDLVGGRTAYLKTAADQLDGLAEVVPECAVGRATVVADDAVLGSSCRLSH